MALPPQLPLIVHNRIIYLRSRIPLEWLHVIGDTLEFEENVHWVDNCLNGLGTPKQFYLWLIDRKAKSKDSAITKWTVDLDISGISEQWMYICKRLNFIRNPSLQDFARSLLNRAYYTNVQRAEFSPVSPKCSFCNEQDETFIHLFWDCPRVQLLWNRVKSLCMEYLEDHI